MNALDLATTYLLIHGDSVDELDGGSAFWERLDADADYRARIGEGWLAGIYPVQQTWTFWEMHPDGDEIVHATAGRFRVILDTEADTGHRTVDLPAGHTVVVPAGTWHTVDVEEPGATLNVTFGRDTQHRPR